MTTTQPRAPAARLADARTQCVAPAAPGRPNHLFDLTLTGADAATED